MQHQKMVVVARVDQKEVHGLNISLMVVQGEAPVVLMVLMVEQLVDPVVMVEHNLLEVQVLPIVYHHLLVWVQDQMTIQIIGFKAAAAAAAITVVELEIMMVVVVVVVLVTSVV